jgi:hypothetical protein
MGAALMPAFGRQKWQILRMWHKVERAERGEYVGKGKFETQHPVAKRPLVMEVS